MESSKIPWRNQKGAIAVIIAIVASLLIGFTAIAVDVGYLYEVRRQLQSAADAAALAGAQELIKDGSETDILNVAESYAKQNDFPKDLGTGEELQMFRTPPQTEIGADYVKVTVTKTVNLFFARIFGISNSDVDAQAKAQVVYLTGGDKIVPWGVTVIYPSRLTAKIGNEPEVELTETSEQIYQGLLSVPSVTNQAGYPVTVTAYNGQVFPESIFPAEYVIVGNSNLIQKVWLSQNYVNDPDSSVKYTTLYVESTGTPQARFNGKNYALTYNSSENRYEVALRIPDITNAIKQFPITVDVPGATTNAVLWVHRSSYPIKSVSIDPRSFPEGPSNFANVTVEMNEFQYGEAYDLKVVSGGESGNFNALDFRYVWHPPDYTTNHGENDSAADYYDNISGVYSGWIHIGDIIETKTGVLSQPTTVKALETRFTGCTHTSPNAWDLWVADEKPLDCGRVVFVPIVEKLERMTGKSEVIVVNLAAFFIESPPDQGTNLKGRFIEYITRTGEYTDQPPPGGIYLKTSRLVNPDF